MAEVVQDKKKIALLHRYPSNRIKETNAAFPHLLGRGIDVLTFKSFERLSNRAKFFKSLLWIFYAPLLVMGKGYDVIYCDDSFPFYPTLVRLVSPNSKLVLRIGDFHLMYYVGGWLYDFLHMIEKISWSVADKVLAISEPMAWQIRMETGKEIDVVLDPVEVGPYEEVEGDGSVMFHGLLTANKNLDLLLECAKRMPKTKFHIVGNGPDMKRLIRIAPRNVEFYGWVDFRDIPLLIKKVSVGVAMRGINLGNEYVVTSPFVQYGALGKPCLVTRRMVFGKYEWQFSGIDEMVVKLKRLLKNPHEEGKKLRKFIEENHDAKKIAEEIWQHLKSV